MSSPRKYTSNPSLSTAHKGFGDSRPREVPGRYRRSSHASSSSLTNKSAEVVQCIVGQTHVDLLLKDGRTCRVQLSNETNQSLDIILKEVEETQGRLGADQTIHHHQYHQHNLQQRNESIEQQQQQQQQRRRVTGPHFGIFNYNDSDEGLNRQASGSYSTNRMPPIDQDPLESTDSMVCAFASVATVYSTLEKLKPAIAAPRLHHRVAAAAAASSLRRNSLHDTSSSSSSASSQGQRSVINGTPEHHHLVHRSQEVASYLRRAEPERGGRPFDPDRGDHLYETIFPSGPEGLVIVTPSDSGVSENSDSCCKDIARGTCSEEDFEVVNSRTQENEEEAPSLGVKEEILVDLTFDDEPSASSAAKCPPQYNPLSNEFHYNTLITQMCVPSPPSAGVTEQVQEQCTESVIVREQVSHALRQVHANEIVAQERAADDFLRFKVPTESHQERLQPVHATEAAMVSAPKEHKLRSILKESRARRKTLLSGALYAPEVSAGGMNLTQPSEQVQQQVHQVHHAQQEPHHHHQYSSQNCTSTTRATAFQRVDNKISEMHSSTTNASSTTKRLPPDSVYPAHDACDLGAKSSAPLPGSTTTTTAAAAAPTQSKANKGPMTVHKVVEVEYAVVNKSRTRSGPRKDVKQDTRPDRSGDASLALPDEPRETMAQQMVSTKVLSTIQIQEVQPQQNQCRCQLNKGSTDEPATSSCSLFRCLVPSGLLSLCKRSQTASSSKGLSEANADPDTSH